MCSSSQLGRRRLSIFPANILHVAFAFHQLRHFFFGGRIVGRIVADINRNRIISKGNLLNELRSMFFRLNGVERSEKKEKVNSSLNCWNGIKSEKKGKRTQKKEENIIAH